MGLLRPLRIGRVTLPNNVLLSPMAGYTDLPFRSLARQHGAGLVCTEMVAALSLEHEGSGTMRRMVTTDAERPVSIQLVGSDVEGVAAGARVAGERCDVLGLNMGCPAWQVSRAGCGAALLGQPELAARLVEAIKASSDAPLLVKMRAGLGGVMDVAAFARMLERAGADGILFHARTAAQGYSGKADWDLIRQVKEAVAIPVVGNGDIRGGPDAARALERSGCDGVAIGRASLGDPRIFARVAAHLERGEALPLPTAEERLADVRAYVRGAQAAGLNWGHVLPHLHSFARGLHHGAALRGRMGRAGTIEAGLALFEAHVAALGPAADAPREAAAAV